MPYGWPSWIGMPTGSVLGVWSPNRKLCGCCRKITFTLTPPSLESMNAGRPVHRRYSNGSPDCRFPRNSLRQQGAEDFRVLVADSPLPLHCVHGRSATSTFPGQQAASLATVLLEGLSHDRVVRALRLLHNTSKLKSLPSDWYTELDQDAPLLKLGHWQVSLDKLAEDSERPDFRPTLLSILDLLSKGA